MKIVVGWILYTLNAPIWVWVIFALAVLVTFEFDITARNGDKFFKWRTPG